MLSPTELDSYQAYVDACRVDPAVQKATEEMYPEWDKMHYIVVAVPLLASVDAHLFPNMLKQYEQQTWSEHFTVVVLVNASPAVMSDEDFDATYEDLKRQVDASSLDVRLIPLRQAPDTKIGELRKLMWDTIALNAKDSHLPGDLGKFYHRSIKHEIVEFVSQMNQGDYLVFNHDADVEYLPSKFISVAVREAAMRYIGTKDHSGAFYSRAVHGRSPNHPNINSVVAIDDYLTSLASSFEAAAMLFTSAYSLAGGFKASARTYEVAGTVSELRGKPLRTLPLVTSPRRFVERLQHTDMGNVWGQRESPEGVFSDNDPCRIGWENMPDISTERRDELVAKMLKDRKLELYFVGRGVDATAALDSEIVKEYSNIKNHSNDTTEINAAENRVRECIVAQSVRHIRVFEKVLSYTCSPHVAEAALTGLRENIIVNVMEWDRIDEDEEDDPS